MARRIDLDTIEIASPCHVPWSSMEGDDRVRFCGDCSKNVYNLVAMTREEACSLIAEHGEDLCVRLHRRSDGKVMTSDCPLGVEMKWRTPVTRFAVVGLLFPIFGVAVSLLGMIASRRDPLKLTGYEPFTTVDEILNPKSFRMVAGGMRMPPRTSNSSGSRGTSHEKSK